MATEPWGVYVERVEVKDVRVPEQLMRAMAAEAEAAREARAKVIAAEGEHKASRALKHAAEVITDSPAALQVMETKKLPKKVNFIIIIFSAEVSSDLEQHLRREQLHHHLPGPHRHHQQLHGPGRPGLRATHTSSLSASNNNAPTATTNVLGGR